MLIQPLADIVAFSYIGKRTAHTDRIVAKQEVYSGAAGLLRPLQQCFEVDCGSR